ncbi:TPA: hypothetical protein U0906_000872 [Streptococcus suis 89-3576-3]|uniref:hypothetical protein n=1 Tax=Streptococcus suis TaxID=1307 RepID=UPI0003F52636|nr:hypothetical protein [Streptococcus suis]QBX21080.1 hypothetical protein Javan553_0005 [Streptococcus phage Javan553]HEM3168920.1 hypothetical protein [Streptococcus suis 89-3576-3]
MGIDNHLKVIKEGVFGRDVRQAIHDGIQQAYDDATANGNANMEVAKARGGFDNLSKRFENITGQLGSIREALTSPFNFKGSLKTSSQLPTAASINDTYYIEDEMARYSFNGKRWFKSSMSENQYLDSLNKIEERLDDSEKFNNLYQSINLFDKTNIVKNKSLTSAIGSKSNNVIDSQGYFYTQQNFHVKAGDVIRFTKSWATLAFYDDKDSLVEWWSKGTTSYTVTNDKIRYFKYLSVIRSDFVDEFMLTINNDLPISYEEYQSIPLDLYNLAAIKNIQNTTAQLSSKGFDKAYVILTIDNESKLEPSKERFRILHDIYGFTASTTFPDRTQMTDELLKAYKNEIANGWDIAQYDGRLDDDNWWDFPTGNPENKTVAEWKEYFKRKKDDAEKWGLYNPTSLLCRRNKVNDNMIRAAYELGFKFTRGGGSNLSKSLGLVVRSKDSYFGDKINIDNRYEFRFRDEALAAIDSAVENKSAICLLSHYIIPQGTVPDGINYNEWDEPYEDVIAVCDKLKEYQDAGKLEVINFKQFYEILTGDTSSIDISRINKMLYKLNM